MGTPIVPAKVFTQTFWMKAFGSRTPKRTVVFSNSSYIRLLDTGRMKKADLKSEVETTVKYTARDGQPRFTGSKHLKSTQFLGDVSVFSVYLSFTFCCWKKSCITWDA